MSNKQSSVEQLESDLKLWFEIMKISFPTEIQNSINRSKAMHKEKIIEARNNGFDSTYAEYGEMPKCYLDGSSEEYYNETFEGDNK